MVKKTPSDSSSSHSDKTIQQLSTDIISKLYKEFISQHKDSPAFASSQDFWDAFWEDLRRTKGSSLLSRIDAVKQDGIFWGDIADWGVRIDSNRASFLQDSLSKITTSRPVVPVFLQIFDKKVWSLLQNVEHNFGAVAVSDYDMQIRQQVASGAIVTITDYAHARDHYLADHASTMSDGQKQLLASVCVDNNDILGSDLVASTDKSTLESSAYSQWNADYQKLFSQLATVQEYARIRENKSLLDKGLESISSTFKEFPPYLDVLLRKYPFNEQQVQGADPSYVSKKEAILSKFQDIEDKKKRGILDAKKYASEKKDVERSLRGLHWHGYSAVLGQTDPELGRALQGLVDVQFVMDKLDRSHKQTLVNRLVKLGISDALRANIPNMFELSEDSFSRFVEDFFDFSKDSVDIQTKDGPITLPFVSKDVQYSFRDIPDITKLEQIGRMPLQFVIKVTDSNEKYLKWVLQDQFWKFSAKNGQHTIHDSYKVQLTDSGGKQHVGYVSHRPPSFIAPTSDSSANQEVYLYSDPVNTVAPGRKAQVLSIPLSDMKNYDLQVLDKQLALNGDAIGSLLFSSLMSHTASEHPSLSSDVQDQLVKSMNPENPYVDTAEYYSEDKENTDEDTSNLYEDDSIGAHEEFENLSGSAEKLVPGVRMFIDLGSSSLPPHSAVWGQVTVENIDTRNNTINLKLMGTEIDLGEYEGHTWSIPYTAKGITDFKQGFTRVVTMPPASGDFIIDLENLKKQSKDFGLEDTQAFLNGDPRYTGKNFEYQGKEVTHFGIVPEGDNDLVLYEVSRSGKGFDVKSTYTSTKNGQPIRFRFEKHMDDTSFALFVSSKGLQAYTDEEVRAIQDKQTQKENKKAKQSGLNVGFFSINQVVSAVKKIGTDFKKKREDYNQKRSDDFLDKMIMDYGLYKKLGNILPQGLGGREFRTMHEEYLGQRDAKIFGEIENIKKEYEGNPDVGLVVNSVCKPFLEANTHTNKPLEAAAALWYAIEKGGGMYFRSLSVYAGEGRWILTLLGPDHQAHYLTKRDELLTKLKSQNIDPDQIKDQLHQLEMRMIVDGIRGGPTEKNDKKQLQQTYSIKFASTIESSFNESQNPEKVRNKFEEMKGKGSFDFAYNECLSNISQLRTKDVIGNLKAMAQLYKSPQQLEKLHMCLLGAMLIGLFSYDTTSNHRDMIGSLSRTIGLLPGIWVESHDPQHKLAIFLSAITGDSFMKNVGQPPSFSQRGKQKQYMNKFTSWWESGNGTLLTKFVNGELIDGVSLAKAAGTQKVSIKGRILTQYEQSLCRELVEFKQSGDLQARDRDISNPKIWQNDLSASIIKAELLNFRAGNFTGDTDSRKASFNYREESIKRPPQDSIRDTAWFFTVFDSVYGSPTTKVYVIKALHKVHELKEKGNINDAKTLLSYIIKGEIGSYFQGVPTQVLTKIEQYEQFIYDNISSIATEQGLQQIPVLADRVSEEIVGTSMDLYMDPNEYYHIMTTRNPSNEELQLRRAIHDERGRFFINEHINSNKSIRQQVKGASILDTKSKQQELAQILNSQGVQVGEMPLSSVQEKPSLLDGVVS